MAYPTLEQYNEALQTPQFVLQDPELKQGRLKTTGLGLPLALCGGFALTYSVEVGARKFALRCFHKESRELERRYQAISARLKQLASPYFIPFDFIPNGIRIQSATFPIVKMAWAQGRTLAEFLESEHRNTAALAQLRQALAKLAEFLGSQRIAHGDIQPENVMVSADGRSVQLIDYDGMFVESLRGGTATELGQINFQHPQRTATDFNERLDRFSFLTLDVALQALIASPAVWNTSRSEPSAVVFRRNDFLVPSTSPVFNDVIRLASVEPHARDLARIAAGNFSTVPTLADFLRRQRIPGNAIVFDPAAKVAVVAYQGAYFVCDATNFNQVLAQVGSRVELVGQIHSVRRAYAKNRQPYIFVNFSDWRGKAVKLAIWSDGMKALGSQIPDESWKGRWVSVTGLVDPPYPGTSYLHLSITITKAGQIQTLSEKEARFRLHGQGRISTPTASRNAEVLSDMVGSGSRRTTAPLPVPPPSPPKSTNQQVLDRMRTQTPPATTTRPHAAPTHRSTATPSAKMSPAFWIFILIVLVTLTKSCFR